MDQTDIFHKEGSREGEFLVVEFGGIDMLTDVMTVYYKDKEYKLQWSREDDCYRGKVEESYGYVY